MNFLHYKRKPRFLFRRSKIYANQSLLSLSIDLKRERRFVSTPRPRVRQQVYQTVT